MRSNPNAISRPANESREWTALINNSLRFRTERNCLIVLALNRCKSASTFFMTRCTPIREAALLARYRNARNKLPRGKTERDRPVKPQHKASAPRIVAPKLYRITGVFTSPRVQRRKLRRCFSCFSAHERAVTATARARRIQ